MIGFDAGEWRFRLIADELNCGDTFDLWALCRRGHNGSGVLQPDGTICDIEQHTRLDGDGRKPLATIPREALGALMNSLWEMGVRPQDKRYETEETLLREVLSTQGKHLEDMQQLVFKERRPAAKGGQ